MNSDSKYQPEDIEFILLNCHYNELNDVQREFVSEIVNSEEEYDLMRQTLINITESSQNKVKIVPPHSIKNKLMAEFEKSDSSRLIWWPNLVGFLFPRGKGFVAKPGVQMAFAMSLLAGLIVLIPWSEINQDQRNLAHQEVDPIQKDFLPKVSIEPISENNFEEIKKAENILISLLDSNSMATNTLNNSNLAANVTNIVEPDADDETLYVAGLISEVTQEFEISSNAVIGKDKTFDTYKVGTGALEGNKWGEMNEEREVIKDDLVLGRSDFKTSSENDQVEIVMDDNHTVETVKGDEALNKSLVNSDISDVLSTQSKTEVVALMESVIDNQLKNGLKKSERTRSIKDEIELIDLLFTAM